LARIKEIEVLRDEMKINEINVAMELKIQAEQLELLKANNFELNQELLNISTKLVETNTNVNVMLMDIEQAKEEYNGLVQEKIQAEAELNGVLDKLRVMIAKNNDLERQRNAMAAEEGE
jgi:hypothetical protein